MTNSFQKIKVLLNKKAEFYNRPSFIEKDPIVVPHRFTLQQDIEIAGFFAAIFAWGIRQTIIRKTTELMQLMDHAPYQFCLQHTQKDLQKLVNFKHRTFNATDLLYCISFLQFHFSTNQSLEKAFTMHGYDVENMLIGFHNYFFSLENFPPRTRKHIATPSKGATCKRLNMYLRWMVRRDEKGVDFGLWKKITPACLVCPLDVHVARVARKLGILTRRQTDWQAALELTNNLRTLDKSDPVKYDFALFGLGITEHY